MGSKIHSPRMSTWKGLFIWIACCHIVKSESTIHSEAITDLTDANLDYTVHGVWMVKFYTPWCGHCKKYAPIFQETAEITSASDGYIHFGQMDCESNDKMCAEYHITGYPTTLLLYNGKLIANYRESRNDATKIRSWIIRQLNAAHLREADILTDAEIESITLSKTNWQNGGINTGSSQNTQSSTSWFSKLPSFRYGDIYYALLGDLSPTVPFLIYLFGTLSGIVIGVCFVLCAN